MCMPLSQPSEISEVCTVVGAFLHDPWVVLPAMASWALSLAVLRVAGSRRRTLTLGGWFVGPTAGAVVLSLLYPFGSDCTASWPRPFWDGLQMMFASLECLILATVAWFALAVVAGDHPRVPRVRLTFWAAIGLTALVAVDAGRLFVFAWLQQDADAAMQALAWMERASAVFIPLFALFLVALYVSRESVVAGRAVVALPLVAGLCLWNMASEVLTAIEYRAHTMPYSGAEAPPLDRATFGEIL